MTVDEIDLESSNSEEIVFFSDVHLHEYKLFSEPTPIGIGSRALTTLSLILEFFRYCIEKKIEYVFMLGDFFHHRILLNSALFDAAAKVFLQAKPLKIFSILGNHDLIYEDQSSATLLDYLPNSYTVKRPTVFKLGNLEIASLPFYRDEEMTKSGIETLKFKCKTKDPILISHFEFMEAIPFMKSSQKLVKSSLSVNMLDSTQFKEVITGHIHSRQQLVSTNGVKVNYCGHFVQNNFRDEGSEAGFIRYHVKTRNLYYEDTDSIASVTVPKFVTLVLGTEDDVKKAVKVVQSQPFNFYKFKIKNINLKLTRLRSLGAKFVEDFDINSSSMNQNNANLLAPAKFHMDLDYYLNLYIDKILSENPTEVLPATKEYLIDIVNKICEENKRCQQ